MKKITIILIFVFASLIARTQCTSKLNPDSVATNGEVVGIAYKYFDEEKKAVYSAIVLYEGNYYEMEAYWINLWADDELVKVKYKGGGMHKKSKRWVNEVLHNENN